MPDDLPPVEDPKTPAPAPEPLDDEKIAQDPEATYEVIR